MNMTGAALPAAVLSWDGLTPLLGIVVLATAVALVGVLGLVLGGTLAPALRPTRLCPGAVMTVDAKRRRGSLPPKRAIPSRVPARAHSR